MDFAVMLLSCSHRRRSLMPYLAHTISPQDWSTGAWPVHVHNLSQADDRPVVISISTVYQPTQACLKIAHP